MRIIALFWNVLRWVAGLALAALVGTAVIPTPAALAADDAKPALTVMIEGGTILAGQSVGAHVWVDNPTKRPITSVRIALASPDDLILQWWSPDLKDWCPRWKDRGKLCPAQDDGVELASSIAPHVALQSPYRLRILAKDSVQEEDVNVAFVLSYRTPGPPGVRTGIQVAEKSLSVGLFGTQTVAGVSLRLTFLFIPGALMLMALKLFKVPAVDQLDATNSAIVTVMVSSGLSLLISWLAAQGWAPGLKPDVGVSVAMLGEVVFLALLIAAGLIGWRLRRLARQKAAAAAVTVGDNDKLEVMLLKALKSAQGDFDPVTVTRRDTTYVGAAAARTASGGMVVMGWYALQTKDADLQAALRRLLGARDYVGALQATVSGGGDLVASDLLRERQGEERLHASSIEGPLRIPAKDRPEATRAWTAGLDVTAPPLILAGA